MRRARGSLWPAGTGRLMVDIYSRIWARRAGVSTQHLLSTCLSWLPGCSRRNSALGKPESCSGCMEGDGLESGVHVFAQTACGPGSGEEKAPCVLLQPRDAWAWFSLLALPRLERAAHTATMREAGTPPAGSSQGRLHGRGGPGGEICGLDAGMVIMVPTDHTPPWWCFLLVFHLGSRGGLPDRGNSRCKIVVAKAGSLVIPSLVTELLGLVCAGCRGGRWAGLMEHAEGPVDCGWHGLGTDAACKAAQL